MTTCLNRPRFIAIQLLHEDFFAFMKQTENYCSEMSYFTQLHSYDFETALRHYPGLSPLLGSPEYPKFLEPQNLKTFRDIPPVSCSKPQVLNFSSWVYAHFPYNQSFLNFFS